MVDFLSSPRRCLSIGLLALSAFPQTLGCGYHNSKRFLEAKTALEGSIYGPANLAKRQRGGDPLATLRILNPYPGVYAYYDGRTGDRFWSQEPNWLDDGAFTLGVSTYAIVDSNEALLYDTHITQEHAAAMLAHVRSLGVNKTTVVYSHYHNDHIAGAVVFSNVSELVGNTITAQVVQSRAPSLPSADPPIVPVLPRTLYNDTMQLMVGKTAVELHHFNIHTEDGTILYLPQRNLLFAGDTLEDTATFISKPADLSTHAAELARMYATFPVDAVRILPAHGSPDRIAAGGYRTTFINATLNYIGKINEQVEQPAAWSQNLSEVVAPDVASGTLLYFAQYEAVHQSNVQSVMEVRSGTAQKQEASGSSNQANRMWMSCLWMGSVVAAFWIVF